MPLVPLLQAQESKVGLLLVALLWRAVALMHCLALACQPGWWVQLPMLLAHCPAKPLALLIPVQRWPRGDDRRHGVPRLPS